MKRNDDTRHYSAKQLSAMRQSGKSCTDWAKAEAVPDTGFDAAHPDDALGADWTRAVIGVPPRKQDVHIRIDIDVLVWFKDTGRGYQTRMNNVLRAFVESRKHTHQ
jgi:uncharacterized protein (DUF4415 family)